MTSRLSGCVKGQVSVLLAADPRFDLNSVLDQIPVNHIEFINSIKVEKRGQPYFLFRMSYFIFLVMSGFSRLSLIVFEKPYF